MRVLWLISILILNGLMMGSALAEGTPAGTPITNQASAEYEDGSGNPLEAVLSNVVTNTVSQVFSVDLQRNQARQAIPGATILFPHTLTNTGNGPDSFRLDVTGADGYPTRIIHDLNGNGVVDPGEPVVAQVGPIAADGSVSLILEISVPPTASAGEVRTVTLTATSSGDSSKSAANQDTLRIVSGPVIQATKESDWALAEPGATVTYTLRFDNAGNEPAQNIILSDSLPNGSAYIAGSLTSSPVGSLEWFDGSSWLSGEPTALSVRAVRVRFPGPLQAGEGGTVSFRVHVLPSITLPATLVNVATVNYEDLAGRPQPQAVTNTVLTAVAQTVGLSFNGAPQQSVAPGGTASFINTLTNTGAGADAFNIELVPGTVPQGWAVQLLRSGNLLPLADTNNDGKPDTGPLAAGETAQVVLRVTVPAGQPAAAAPIILQKSATSVRDASVSGVASDPVLVVSTGIPSLSLTKTVSPEGEQPHGATLTYTLTYANTGSVALVNARITDPIPALTTFVSASEGGVFNPETKIVTWSLGALAPGATGTVTLTVTIQ